MKSNMKLKIAKPPSLASMADAPYTPLEQTVHTPIHPEPFPIPRKEENIYSNAQYNESDDLLTDVDEPKDGFCATKKYSLSFTPHFDKLMMSIYSAILSLPTTTPFSGFIPPSGLVSKVANELIKQLIVETETPNFLLLDHQAVVNHDFLTNGHYQPIFLQLVRKRLIDICSLSGPNSTMSKAPPTTTISINCNTPYSNNTRQTSISNLSLTDANIATYNAGSSNNSTKSRSSSISLRKQSLTRHNSYSGNNWLHVGNLNNIKQHYNGNLESLNSSTDSLQSMQDYVAQPYINRSAGLAPANVNANVNDNTPEFNNLMGSYQTPPNSNKSSVSEMSDSPNWSQSNGIQIIHQSTNSSNDSDYFNFISKASNPKPPATSSLQLSINTEEASQAQNLFAAGKEPGLDSPFMSAITPNEDFGFFHNNTPYANNTPHYSSDRPLESPKDTDPMQITSTNSIKDAISVSQFSLSEKKRDSLKMKRGIL